MLKIRNLNVSLNHQHILKNLNLDIDFGESLSIIGESGTGKTTLAKTIMGLCEGMCTGDIFFHQDNLTKITSSAMNKIRWNKISMVFQNVETALNPLYNILQQVTEPMIVHGQYNKDTAKEKAIRLLQMVGICDHQIGYFPHQLSGGQKQRVLIAMAMANEPELIILDEPTASLDPLTKMEIIYLLQKIENHTTFMVVTHDFATAAKLTQKTAVLYAGKVVEYGNTKDILENPKHPYTRGLLRSYPNMHTTKDLQGIPGRLERTQIGCVYESRCTQKIMKCKEMEPALKIYESRHIACHLGGIIPLLQINNLSKSFSKERVIEQISLSLAEGETLAIVGESGSGKTTLARCIMGIYDKYDGEIKLEKDLIKKRKKDFFRKVQMIYQNPAEAISHRLTVLDAVSEPLKIHNIGNFASRKEEVKKVLDEVELPNDDKFLNCFAHHLSGGEAQRLAIARALILKPKLLLADEPTSALDPSVQAKILKLLLNLQEKRGLSMVFITHDLAVARKISDKILVLMAGKVVEYGSTEQVMTKPNHDYTKRLLLAAPSLDVYSAMSDPSLIKKKSFSA